MQCAASRKCHSQSAVTLAPRQTSADCLTATHSSVLPGCASCVQGANWVHKDLMNLRPSRLYTLWYMAGCKGSSKAGPAPFVLSQKQVYLGDDTQPQRAITPTDKQHYKHHNLLHATLLPGEDLHVQMYQAVHADCATQPPQHFSHHGAWLDSPPACANA